MVGDSDLENSRGSSEFRLCGCNKVGSVRNPSYKDWQLKVNLYVLWWKVVSVRDVADGRLHHDVESPRMPLIFSRAGCSAARKTAPPNICDHKY